MNKSPKMSFHDKLKDLIVVIENLLSNPQDETQLEQWKDAAETIAYSYVFTDVEQERIDLLIDMYEEQFKRESNGIVTIPLSLLYLSLTLMNYLDENN